MAHRILRATLEFMEHTLLQEQPNVKIRLAMTRRRGLFCQSRGIQDSPNFRRLFLNDIIFHRLIPLYISLVVFIRFVAVLVAKIKE